MGSAYVSSSVPSKLKSLYLPNSHDKVFQIEIRLDYPLRPSSVIVTIDHRTVRYQPQALVDS